MRCVVWGQEVNREAWKTGIVKPVTHPNEYSPLSHSDCHVGDMHVTRWLTIEQSLGSEGGTLGHTFPMDWTEPGSEAIHSATAHAQPTWKLSLRKRCNH